MHPRLAQCRHAAMGLRIRALSGSDEVLLVNKAGRFAAATPRLADAAASDTLVGSARAQCERLNLVRRDADLLGALADQYACEERRDVSDLLDYLILVPTLRCNLSCTYCQVSRVAADHHGFDWDDRTTEAVLDMLGGLATRHIKIEFQGGEPTLRPDLIQAVIDRCGNFESAEFVICTNLQHLTPDVLALFDRPDVFISTSLDGNAATHARHRTGEASATDRFLENLRFVVYRYGPNKVSALPTIDPRHPPDPDELIDAYLEFGLTSIFLRPINFQGFARKRHSQQLAAPSRYTPPARAAIVVIPLSLPAQAECEEPFVARLRRRAIDAADAALIQADPIGAIYSSREGLISIDGADADQLDGEVVLVQPNRIDRLIRANSKHNTLLVTERCDQLCAMCSQPPKKSHVDRFPHLEEACLLAEPGTLIGITGGEPTLFKDQLFGMLERVLRARPDLEFHVLTNGQHFEPADILTLSQPEFRRVSWGIPLYATEADLHDEIVGKLGAFGRLLDSFATLLRSGARVELRTVLLTKNASELSKLAVLIAAKLRFIETWSIMQLENIGFARRRWTELLYDHAQEFGSIAEALNLAILHGVRAQLFNFPLCTVPESYRRFAVASVSDWKRKLVAACGDCSAATQCSGFFDWHPDEHANRWAKPL